MDEHDDDLDSTVHEGASGEVDAFPDACEDLDAAAVDRVEDEEEESSPGEDESEL